MKIHFLGTSSACPSLNRNVSATAVSFDSTKSWLLVDCGEGTQHQILKSELASYHLSVILITHLHGDHCYGLPGLIASISLAGRKEPVHLVAPKAVIDFVLSALKFTQMETGFELICCEIEALEHALDFSFCQVSIHPLKHRVPSVAFKITERNIPRKLHLDKLANDGVATGSHYNLLQKGRNVEFQGKLLRAEEYSFPSWQPRKVIICGDNEKPKLLADVVEDIDLAESRRLQAEALEEQKRITAELMILQKREDDRQRSMIIIAVGNVIAILLGLLVWFVVRKVKVKKKAQPEMQLKAPK